jgi:uncharacterized protein (DUF2126 family)
MAGPEMAGWERALITPPSAFIARDDVEVKAGTCLADELAALDADISRLYDAWWSLSDALDPIKKKVSLPESVPSQFGDPESSDATQQVSYRRNRIRDLTDNVTRLRALLDL